LLESNTKFDNQKFWNNRYQTDPLKGSGIGSRGKNKDFKQKIINNILKKYQPESILDVGCGDLEVIKELSIKKYTGVDISEIIIEKNTKLRPDWTFIHGNFVELQKVHQFKADLVLCFDVLIHQHVYDEYLNFAKLLIDATRKIGMISAYEGFPDNQYRSEIIAYHEPISKTLSDLGAKSITRIGSYRQTAIFIFSR